MSNEIFPQNPQISQIFLWDPITAQAFRAFREFCGRLEYYPWEIKIFPQISQISQNFQCKPHRGASPLCIP